MSYHGVCSRFRIDFYRREFFLRVNVHKLSIHNSFICGLCSIRLQFRRRSVLIFFFAKSVCVEFVVEDFLLCTVRQFSTCNMNLPPKRVALSAGIIYFRISKRWDFLLSNESKIAAFAYCGTIVIAHLTNDKVTSPLPQIRRFSEARHPL